MAQNLHLNHSMTDLAPHLPADLFPNLAEGIPGGVYVVRDDRVLYANRELARLFGHSLTIDWVGSQFFKGLYPDQETVDLIRQGHRQIMERGCDHTAWAQPSSRIDGTPFWIEVEARRIQVDGAPAILGWVHDATDCKLISEAMQASQGTLRGLLDAMDDQVYLVDDEFRILYANQKMASNARADPASEPCFRVCRGIDRPCDDCTKDQVLDRGETVHRELRDELTGTWYSVVELPVQVAGSERPAKLGVRRDITLRKEAEQRIRALSHRLIATQEEERGRLSRELHDDLGQQLNAIKIGLETFQEDLQGVAPELAERAEALCRRLHGSVQSVRRLSSGLRPDSLERLGLVNAIQEHCTAIAALHGLDVKFRTAGMDGTELDPAVAINLYRVVQEALHNVVKHARATGVEVGLTASFPTVLLRIEDDGAGFNPDAPHATDDGTAHLGLVNIGERVELLDGTWLITSRPGRGTRIRVEVPLHHDGVPGTGTAMDGAPAP